MRSRLALAIGLLWFGGLMGLGLWILLVTGYPHFVFFLAPVAAPGALLAVWGSRPAQSGSSPTV